MLTRVEVTATHIDVGIAVDCHRCPLALAIAEHVRDGVQVSVLNGCATFGRHPDENIRSRLPQEAVDFYHTFDLNQKGEPFAFDLDIPYVLLRPTEAA